MMYATGHLLNFLVTKNTKQLQRAARSAHFSFLLNFPTGTPDLSKETLLLYITRGTGVRGTSCGVPNIEVPYNSFRNIALRKNTHTQLQGTERGRPEGPSRANKETTNHQQTTKNWKKNKKFSLTTRKDFFFLYVQCFSKGLTPFPRHPHYALCILRNKTSSYILQI